MILQLLHFYKINLIILLIFFLVMYKTIMLLFRLKLADKIFLAQ